MRNWSALLIDAGLRGVSGIELARELGIAPSQVYIVCKRYGVALPLAQRGAPRGAPKPPGFGPQQHLRAREKWAHVFERATRGATLNQFCKHYKCSYTTAERWAREFGYTFAPAKKRRLRNVR